MPFAFTFEHIVSLGRTPFVGALSGACGAATQSGGLCVNSFAPFFGSHTRHDQAIIHDAMQTSATAPLAERVFNELSGGERQRVMVAMALAQRRTCWILPAPQAGSPHSTHTPPGPHLLLLDEPTSHLDIKYQIEILELIQRLNREHGVTVIAAMHDLNLAARYFPRLLLFQRGVVADANPAEILEPGLLRRVYGVNVQVGILRGAEHLSVLPPSSVTQQTLSGGQCAPHTIPRMVSVVLEHVDQSGPQVHVIAGGGAGELMMRALADAHIPFVAGALNIGDSDHTLALRLANEVITEQPYAPISPEALQRVHTSLTHVSLASYCKRVPLWLDHCRRQ